jgi:hypothetical protein
MVGQTDNRFLAALGMTSNREDSRFLAALGMTSNREDSRFLAALGMTRNREGQQVPRCARNDKVLRVATD